MSVIHRSDYQPSAYLIKTVTLDITLTDALTTVISTLMIEPQDTLSSPLVLNGEDITLLDVALNQKLLDTEDYACDDTAFILKSPPKKPFRLSLKTTCRPQDNTQLSGLYRSQDMFCTQCEAEGFRRITYFLDRPDILSEYHVKITANKAKYPILLSNGNRIDSGVLGEDRHWVLWHDPHPKPCYLFALVAGDLSLIQSSYYSALRQKEIQIEFYVRGADVDQVDWAIESLKASMDWDEKTYALAYDLDLYMVVAVSDFNMGAMENKGLNIFNTKYVLARPELATDQDLQAVEAVIGHEYFHNYTGNRVTLRDWFQLSLKEGLTVFREQSFSESQGQSAVKRIDEAKLMMEKQFQEDAGPLSHPVRPAQYQQINNFYTLTIYHKGSALMRVFEHWLGASVFNAGVRHYLKKHDGQAATCDDFVQALSEIGQQDLSLFMTWYDVAGTPKIAIQEDYCDKTQMLTLTLTQENVTSPEAVYPIPVTYQIYDESGAIQPAMLVEGEGSEQVLKFEKRAQQWRWQNIKKRPIVTYGDGFSAPVNYQQSTDVAALSVLYQHAQDPVTQWMAAQSYQKYHGQQAIQGYQAGKKPMFERSVFTPIEALLNKASLDPARVARLIQPVCEKTLALSYDKVPVEAVSAVCLQWRTQLAEQCYDSLLLVYQRYEVNMPLSVSSEDISARALMNAVLSLMAYSPQKTHQASTQQLIAKQYAQDKNMTLKLGALKAGLVMGDAIASPMCSDFYQYYQSHALVIDKWLTAQALSLKENALEKIKALSALSCFDSKNPNKIYALWCAFAEQNFAGFHQSVDTYDWLAQQVKVLDKYNPQVAARVLNAFAVYPKLDAVRREAMKTALLAIQPHLTASDTQEVLEKILEAK